MFGSFISPLDYVFHRPMLEREGTYVIEKDGKLFLLINALGISPDDIKFDIVQRDYYEVIKISGETYNKTFDKPNTLLSSYKIYKKIKNVDWSLENGFLTLEIEFSEPVKPDVTINRKLLAG